MKRVLLWLSGNIALACFVACVAAILLIGLARTLL